MPILDAEERRDWHQVQQLSDALNRELMEQNINAPEIVDHYLDDTDIRASDDRYAKGQRLDVRRFVETGEHTEGTTVPLWSCAVAVAAIGGGIIWLLT